MIGVPRGRYLGKRLAIQPRATRSTSFAAPPGAAGSIAVIWATSSRMRVRYRTLRRINRNDGRSVRGA
jgi:hypothetical protein